ncbi:hypothetical protein ScPMuIL_011274 [Solemya velum]
MGIHRTVSNIKRPALRDRKWKLQRLRKAERKKSQPVKARAVEDVHLLSKDQLKKLAKGTSSSLNVSGKRRRKMMKRIGHLSREKNRMDVETDVTKLKKSKKKTVSVTDTNAPSTSHSEDVEMTAVD